ncbi:MAG: hypothetical protein VXV92_01415, partial [Bacteroidota bacterium]|nr:hypothetical protein [Bacteroidota bacterium]
MKKSLLFLLSTAFLILFVRCDSNVAKDSKVNEVKINESLIDEEYLGIYIGIQNSYFMENKFGDYLIINGNKVPVPGSEYRFLIEDDNKISLQQKSMEDESRYYYEGNFTVFSITDDKIIIEAELIYDEFSSPSYKIEINKETKEGECIPQDQSPS